jgi:PEP-CTERM motif-containing protein
MKKQLAIALLAAGITAGSLSATNVPALREYDLNDTIQPIRPDSDEGAGNLRSSPSVTVAAVPEPSTISLLAGAAIIGSWFCLRRRRR